MNKYLLNDNFGTLSETINALIKIGYTHDFNIQEECLVCHQTRIILHPNDFQIDKVYRFEGASNPADQSILYAISSAKFKTKGTLVNGYGISSNEISSKLIEELQLNSRPISVEPKSIDATPQRPEGDRILNAQLVEMNLYEFIDQLKRETTWIDNDRNSVTIFKSETMRIVLIGLHKSGEIELHKANGVISVQVLKGKVNLITEQQSSLMEKGQMVALQENIYHSVIALTESFFLLTIVINNE